MKSGDQRFGIDQYNLDLMPSFDPLDARDRIANMAMNTAGKPWSLANTGGTALGKPASALGMPGSALGSSGSALGSAGSALGTPGSALGGTATNASKFGLDLGSKSASNLGLGTGATSGFNWGSMAGMLPQVALQLGIPQAMFGRYAGNTLAQGGSGALTGMAMGGPVGGAVGGGIGLLAGLLGGGGQRPRPQVPVNPASPDYLANY